MALTQKQKLFCDEYLIDLNATRAYRAVYKNCKSDEAAAVCASKLLRNAKVEKYIEKRMKEREKRTEITQDMVVKELAAIAFSKATDYAKVIETQAVFTTETGKRIPLIKEDGKPVMVYDVKLTLSENLTEEQIKAIAGIKHGKFGIEVATCDKVKALELLGRHLGMFKEKVEVLGLDEEKKKLDEIIDNLIGGGG